MVVPEFMNYLQISPGSVSYFFLILVNTFTAIVNLITHAYNCQCPP